MKKSINVIKKGRGRPATGQGTLIGVRLQPSQLKALDAWIDKQDASLTRPEAIRAILAKEMPKRSIDSRAPRGTNIPSHPPPGGTGAEGEEMMNRHISTLLAVLACLLVAAALIGWFSMGASEFFLAAG
jgi:hypothetical protein